MNATIYNMIRSILAKPMPGVNAERLVSLGVLIDGRMDDPANSFVNYREYAAQSKTVQPILARGFDRFTLTLEQSTWGVRGCLVTTNYFETLGVRLVRGRPFRDEDERSNDLTVIISHRTWLEHFNGTKDIAGRSLIVNGKMATILGVTPPGFRGVQMGEQADVWVPILTYSRLQNTLRDLNDPAIRGEELIGKLVPEASLAQARAEFDTISKRLQIAYPQSNQHLAAMLEPYSALGPGTQRARAFLPILMAVAIIVLLVICANVANLSLAKSVARQREMAVRQSIGASRWRVMRMLLGEGFAIALISWAAACCLAWWASRALPHLLPGRQGTPIDLDFSPDWRIAVYALSLALLSTVAFTAAPALRTWRQELLPWLKSGEFNATPSRSRLANVLVVTQLGLCVLLLTSAGLLSRSLYLLKTLDLHPGGRQFLSIGVNTKGSVTSKEGNLALLERLRERLGALPRIEAVSYARAVPPRVWSASRVEAPGALEPVMAETNQVGPDYFETVGIAPLLGRGFSVREASAARKVVVINEQLANRLWPGKNPLGESLKLGDRAVEVIGVVPNGIFAGNTTGRIRSFLFLLEAQQPAEPDELTLHVRYQGRLEAMAPAIRRAIHDTDSRVAVLAIQTEEDLLQDFTSPLQFIAGLLGFFASGTLLLAALGLYAVISFNMSRRIRDFGIRMALGATSADVTRSVMREGVVLSTTGLLLGVALSLGSLRVLGSILFGITPTDTITYVAVFGLLGTVSSLGCYLPARRAARIDPVLALRED